MNKKTHILIVEDLPTDAELARREIDKALKKCAYRVVETREEFLDALETFSPDLIVSDFKLPSFDGLTALKLTLKRTPETPVIILTGSQNEDTAVECMKAGATDYVIKEHIKRLGSAVVVALEQKRLKSEKERAEASLRENEERYRTITENMSDTVWVMDMNFKNTFISPSVLKTRGYTLDELNALPLSKHVTPESFEVMSRAIAEEMTAERLADKDITISRSIELEFCRKDGSTFWADIVMTLVRDADGRPKEIIGVGRDITARRQSETLLKESESKYRSILETIHEGYFEVDLKGNFTFFNESMARMLAYNPTDLMGLNYRVYMDKQNAKEVFETFNAVFRTGLPRQALGWQLIRNDGTCIFVETSVSVKGDESGTPIGFFGVAHDITERVKAEEALRESEERFKQVAESAGEWIWEVDANGLYTYASPVVEKIIGYKPEEIIGKKFFYDLFHPEDGESFKAAALAAFAAKQPFREFINRNVHKNGQTIWLATSGSPLLDDKGNLLGYRGADTDITERNRAEEELKRSEEKFRVIAEIVPEAFFIYSLETNRYEYLSPASEVIFGRSLIEHYKNPQLWYEAVHPDDRERVSKAIFDSLDKGFEVDFRIIRPDGSIRWVFSRSFPVRDEKGNIIRLIGANQDITERKRAEEALLQRERQLSAVADNLPGPVSQVDHNLRYLFVNAQYERWHGKKPESMLGRTIPEVIGDEAFRRAKPYIKQALAGQRVTFEAPIEVSSGATLYGLVTYVPDVGSDGKVKGFFIVVNDITERKLAEEALRESEERFRIGATSVSDLVWDWNIQERKLDWFGDIDGMLGYSSGEFPRTIEAWEKVIHPEDRNRVLASVEHHLKKRAPYSEEYRVIRKDGTLRHWTDRGSAILDKEGKAYRMVGACSDITERKQAEDKIREINRSLFERTAELKESEVKWRTLFETSKDVVYISALEGAFIDINRAGEELFGCTRDELLTMNVKYIYKDPRDREAFIKKVTEQGFVKDYEVTFKKKDGALIDCLLTSSIKVDGDGKVIGFQGIIRDVSERKKMERQLVQAEKLSSLGGILSGVAHELNNPLTAIIGNAELLMRKEITQEIQDKLETIRKESLRSSKIIQGLLAFAREHKPQRRMIAVNDVIRETYNLREYELRVDDVTMRLDLSDDIPKTAADPYLLQQVFINLINNAHDALVTTGGGALVIRSSFHDGTIVIEFTDDGPGIPESILKFVFDPFFTTKEVGKGTGLGLSIVYGIVKEHDGTIDVTSTPGKGATFTIELPVSRDPARKEERPEERPKRPEGKKTVLVVEDEQSLRDMINEALTEEGYLVDCADGGEKAIELIEKRRYDAVVSDLKMPGISGKDLYTFVQKNYPHLVDKTLFITGDVLGKETQGFLRITRSPFVEKPFRIEVLLARLSDIVSG